MDDMKKNEDLQQNTDRAQDGVKNAMDALSKKVD